MAWDDDKSTATDEDNPAPDEQLTASEWDAHVADQKGHASRHSDGGGDELDVSDLAGGNGTADQVATTDGSAVSWSDIVLAMFADSLDTGALDGSQGTDGQVWASTGSGAQWEDVSGGSTVTEHNDLADDVQGAASVDNSGATFIQDLTLDEHGHVTGITSADAPSDGGGGGSGTGDGIQRFAEELDPSGGDSPIRRWGVFLADGETVEVQRATVAIWDDTGSFTTDAGVELNWHEAGSSDVTLDDAGSLDVKTGSVETWTNNTGSPQFGWIEVENTTANTVQAWGEFKIVNDAETSTGTSTNTFSELNVTFTDDSSTWVYDSRLHADQGSSFTIYCDPNGSSTADGLTQANAVTLERAFELVPRHPVDDVTLDLATVPSLPVTYDPGGNGVFPPAIYPLTTAGQFNFRGDTTTPSNVKITPKMNVMTGIHKGDHYRIEGVEMQNGIQFNGTGIIQNCNIFDAGTRGVSGGIIGAKQNQNLVLDGVTLGNASNDEETLFNWTHGNSTVLMQQVDMVNDGSVPTACGKQGAELHVRFGGVTLNGTGVNNNLSTAQMNHICNSGVELHFETGEFFIADNSGNGRYHTGTQETSTVVV